VTKKYKPFGGVPDSSFWRFRRLRPVGAWKLTVRDGSDVSHENYDELSDAVDAMRARALAIRAEGPAKPVSSLRDYGPQDQVRARLQLSGGGWLRKAVAGVDVRGDGTFMPFRGGIRREELDPAGHDTPFDLVRETLERDG
jgi:hypothetical protein